MVRAGDVIADRFELIELAGAGGMGEVWRARDRLEGVPVAVKMMSRISEDGRTRFLREAIVLSELRHPSIVKYVAHGVTPGQHLYLVMEWLEGEALSQRLKRSALSPTLRERSSLQMLAPVSARLVSQRRPWWRRLRSELVLEESYHPR
jgi:serine/threonine protein kinase